MKKNTITKYLRNGLLGLFLILITVQAYLHQVKGGGEEPSIHALCPYGGLESLYNLLGSGTFIQKIFTGTMVLFIITLVLAVVFRRSFCGLICPFGALQEFFAWIGKKVFKRKFIMPQGIDKPLRYLKYVVLLITVAFAWQTAGLWMDPYDPWAAYAHITEGISALTETYLIGFILLIVTAIGSMIYDRFFCKYLCPMGALYGAVSKISPSKIARNEDMCINCGICNKSCPANINVSGSKQITSAECINCQKCVLSCPKEGALEYKVGTKSLKPLVTVVLVISVFFGGVFASKAVGIYQTIPNAVKAGTTLSVDEIKGYMTLKEASTYLNMDIKELCKKFGIPDNIPADTKLKDISNFVPGFSVDAAKEKLKQK